MKKFNHQTMARIALFLCWLIILGPVYSANALEIAFNPETDIHEFDLVQ